MVDHTSFAEDIMKSVANPNIKELDLDSIVSFYNGNISDVLDKHAPLEQKKVLDHPTVP